MIQRNSNSGLVKKEENERPSEPSIAQTTSPLDSLQNLRSIYEPSKLKILIDSLPSEEVQKLDRTLKNLGSLYIMSDLKVLTKFLEPKDLQDIEDKLQNSGYQEFIKRLITMQNKQDLESSKQISRTGAVVSAPIPSIEAATRTVAEANLGIVGKDADKLSIAQTTSTTSLRPNLPVIPIFPEPLSYDGSHPQSSVSTRPELLEPSTPPTRSNVTRLVLPPKPKSVRLVPPELPLPPLPLIPPPEPTSIRHVLPPKPMLNLGILKSLRSEINLAKSDIEDYESKMSESKLRERRESERRESEARTRSNIEYKNKHNNSQDKKVDKQFELLKSALKNQTFKEHGRLP